MPPSTLQINLDKTYNIVLFKGLFNGEFNHNTYGVSGPVSLYRQNWTIIINVKLDLIDTSQNDGKDCEGEFFLNSEYPSF